MQCLLRLLYLNVVALECRPVSSPDVLAKERRGSAIFARSLVAVCFLLNSSHPKGSNLCYIDDLIAGAIIGALVLILRRR
jgi:hypothetical protein